MFCFPFCLRSFFCYRFLFRLILNRRLLGNFEFSRTFAQTFYLFTFRFLAFSIILDKLQKTKTETKKPHFCRFCLKTSVFVANKTLIFSYLQVYGAKYTPPSPFLALAGWVSSSPNFFIFFIFYFCKIL